MSLPTGLEKNAPQDAVPLIQFGTVGQATPAPVAPVVPTAEDKDASSPASGEQFTPVQVRAIALRRVQQAAQELSEVHLAHGLADPLASLDLSRLSARSDLGSVAPAVQPDPGSSARARRYNRADQALDFSTPLKRPKQLPTKVVSSAGADTPMDSNVVSGSGYAPGYVTAKEAKRAKQAAVGMSRRSDKRVSLGAKLPAQRYLQSSKPVISTRQVTSDLPYSLAVAGPAGWLRGGYLTPDQALADLQQYLSYLASSDPRSEELAPRLLRAGMIAPREFNPAVPVGVGGAVADATEDTSESSSDEEEEPQGDDVEAYQMQQAVQASLQPQYLQSQPQFGCQSFAGPTATAGPAFLDDQSPFGMVPVASGYKPKVADGIRKDIPAVLDLDDSAQSAYSFYRYESSCAVRGEHQDTYVTVLEGRLDQPRVPRFAERTRLLAVNNWCATHRDPVTHRYRYADFKAVCEKVTGGEKHIYTRKTLAALSQKGSGSFHQYLADFETQAAYVKPSSAERLELFQAGLVNGLRNKVLVHSDGEDCTSWKEFLRVVTRFADAELRSRDLPSKAFHVEAGSSSKRPAESQPAKGKKAKKAKKQASSSQAATASAPLVPGTHTMANSHSLRFKAVKPLCLAAHLCTNCLKPYHDTDRAGPKRLCSRAMADPAQKWPVEYPVALEQVTAKQKNKSV